jgi:hypothetical protein
MVLLTLAIGAATVDHQRVKTNDHAVAACHRVDPARWQEAFEATVGRIAGRFARVEPRRRIGRLVLGLLSDLPRKNCWSIAEWAGDASLHGIQHLPPRAVWDASAVRECVVEHLHDEAAVLAVDETGGMKKGHPHCRRPAPVHRHRWKDRERPGRRLPRLRG